jgi:hypothetical protein
MEQLQFNNRHTASISSKTSLNLIELLKWSMELLSTRDSEVRPQKSTEKLYLILHQKKKRQLMLSLYKGGRAVSNRRPPEPQSGALTN